MTSNEMEALKVCNNKILLKKRLMSARSVLVRELYGLFNKHTFDFEQKRLVSSCGKYALQWRLRDKPNEPESYENQQTSIGGVFFIEL